MSSTRLLVAAVVLVTLLPPEARANLRRPKFDRAGMPPEAWLSTPELVTRWGYPVERHRVQTDDGYVLEVHRIPGPRGWRPSSGCGARTRPAVLMTPGFGATSECLVLRENDTLAFMLAEADYDVWLGNFRGSAYGRAHKTLRPSDARFWDFSFHENGVHDVASMLDYVARATGQAAVLYVGHSMGSTALLALLADRPEYNARVRAAFMLAPAVYFQHTRGGFAAAKQRMRWSYGSLAPVKMETPLTRAPSPGWCFPNNRASPSAACWKFLADAQGPFHSVKNNTYITVLLHHWPAGTSVGQLSHFGQLIIRGDGFYKYDHGPQRNLGVYGTVYPPAYNLTNVQTPSFVFYSRNDFQAHYKDVKKLAADLPGLAGLHETPVERFNHIDIMYEEAAADLVYKRLLQEMIKYR